MGTRVRPPAGENVVQGIVGLDNQLPRHPGSAGEQMHVDVDEAWHHHPTARVHDAVAGPARSAMSSAVPTAAIWAQRLPALCTVS